MTLYLKLKMKDLLTNLEILGWGIVFIEFWVLMWLFVFSKGAPAQTEWDVYVVNINAAMAYSFLGLLSMAAVAISLAYSIFYTSRAARYLTKFTRASPATLMVEDFVASLAAIIIIVAVIIFSVIGCTYMKWGIIPHVENPAAVFVDLVLSGVALYWLAYMLALVLVVTRRTRALSMMSFVPLILAFIAYAQLWVDFGNLVYVIPLSTIPALLVYHSTGAIPPTGSYLWWLGGGELLQAVNLKLAAVSLFAWIFIFAGVSLILLRKSRGVPIEELRF